MYIFEETQIIIIMIFFIGCLFLSDYVKSSPFSVLVCDGITVWNEGVHGDNNTTQRAM